MRVPCKKSARVRGLDHLKANGIKIYYQASHIEVAMALGVDDSQVSSVTKIRPALHVLRSHAGNWRDSPRRPHQTKVEISALSAGYKQPTNTLRALQQGKGELGRDRLQGTRNYSNSRAGTAPTGRPAMRRPDGKKDRRANRNTTTEIR
jgi:hypothetical protein